MSLIDNIINRALSNLGFSKEEVDKVKTILGYVDIRHTQDGIEINIKLKNVKVIIEKDSDEGK